MAVENGKQQSQLSVIFSGKKKRSFIITSIFIFSDITLFTFLNKKKKHITNSPPDSNKGHYRIFYVSSSSCFCIAFSEKRVPWLETIYKQHKEGCPWLETLQNVFWKSLEDKTNMILREILIQILCHKSMAATSSCPLPFKVTDGVASNWWFWT